MLTRSELEQSSFFYYLKEGILGREFSQEVQAQPLVYDTKLYDGQQRFDYRIADPNNSQSSLATSLGRGWLSFHYDELNECYIYNPATSGYVPTYNTPFFNQSFSIPMRRENSYVVVRDQNNLVLDRTWYQIDYDSGRIRYPCPTTPSGAVVSGIIPTSVDYRFHSVSLVDGWPDSEKIPSVPFVSLYPTTEYKKGFQLGGGVEFTREYAIDVFASSKANREKLLDKIASALYNKHAPVIDFNRSGFPLKPHGAINENFIQNLNHSGNNYSSYLTLNPGNGNNLYFLDNRVLHSSASRSTMSTSMRHMGSIRVSTCTYSDKDPELVGKYAGLVEPVGGFDSLIKKSYSG